MMLRYFSGKTLFIRIIATLLIVCLLGIEVSLAQTTLYLEGENARILKENLPEWMIVTENRKESEWVVNIRFIEKSPLFFNLIMPYVGFLYFIGAIGVATQEYENSLRDALLVGLAGAFSFWNPYKEEGIYKYEIQLSNVLTGDYLSYPFKYKFVGSQSKFTNGFISKARTPLVAALYKITGEQEKPVIYLRSEIISETLSPDVKIDLVVEDDVYVGGIGVFVNGLNKGYFNVSSEKLKQYQHTLDIPLYLGRNEITLIAFDWSLQITEKSFTIFRKKGYVSPGPAPAPVVRTSYPPLLSISDISFVDESNDGFLDAGEGGTLSFLIKNEGKGPANDLKINIQMDEEGISITPLEITKTIASNDSILVKYTLIANATIPTGEVTLEVSTLDRKTKSPAIPINYLFKTRGRLSDVDIEIPKGKKRNTNGIAVIIGNKDYTETGLYPVDYALLDAEIVKKYVLQTLRFKEDNIIYSPNATLSEMRSIFGSEGDSEGRLHNLIFPNKSDVFVYYSGHGAPGLENKKGYLLPVNVRGDDAQRNGYSLELLNQNLTQLPAKSVTLVVDACFSGQSEKGSLIPGASGPYIEVEDPLLQIPNGNSFFASKGDEMSSWFHEQKHSLFTYYFLKGLRGEADDNKDKKITAGELKKYLKENVPYKVRRLYSGRNQNPVITTSMSDYVIVRY